MELQIGWINGSGHLYDTAGRQTGMREKTVGATLDDQMRTFAFDSNGMIVSRRDGTATSANVFQRTARSPQRQLLRCLG